MNISIATLCDHAADFNGKLVICGTFDSVLVRELPVQQACMFAVRLHCTPRDNGSRTLTVTVTDSTGTPIGEAINLEFAVDVPEDLGVVSRNLVLNVPLRFDQPGLFGIEVRSGEEVLNRTPLVIAIAHPDGENG